MPPRLAVIISQAPTRDHRAAEIEESVVGELMITNGLDANLVGPLQRIQPDSTDLLCLASYSQDFALLSWLPLDEAQQAWSDLQLPGTLVEYPPAQSGQAQSGTSMASAAPRTGRRITYLRLHAASDPREICQRLKNRLQDLQVKTVSLLPLATSSTAQRTASSPPPTPPQLPVTNLRLPTTSAHKIPAATDEVNTDNHADMERWRKLDQLVDDLDALDL